MGHDTLAQDSAHNASTEASKDGGTPKLKRKDYEKTLSKLQTELSLLQDWVKRTGERIIVIFEGRDAAGKGGSIRALTERVSPRTFRVVALPAPSDREKSQMYVQRYIAHFPAAGEIVIFDRSWYNRAGVEHVMGFCTKEQHKRFLEVCPEFEKQITDNGI
ncbi:MAG TPA: polyphosphate kinase 2, partial [Methyloceanibacter sp.]|nr:polyphosphate kinase 2 [Methyloceanibacter sp.]